MGGFVCVPGSHKPRYPMPPGHGHPPSLRHVGCRRGDLLFFLGSAQTHGVLPWRGEDQRRCVIAKYAPAAVALPAGHALVPDFARTAERSVARF